MIGTCSRCKQKNKDVRQIYSYQLCKDCFNKAKSSKHSDVALERYKNVWNAPKVKKEKNDKVRKNNKSSK